MNPVPFVLGLGLIGAGAYWLTRNRTVPASADVRDAGPDAMTNPPERWDTVDEQADESFPASDPPGNY